MSLTLSLIPLAIALNASIATGVTALVATQALSAKEKKNGLPPIETVFMDSQLLCKTLSEHGLQIRQVSNSEYIVETQSGVLHYFRRSADTPFMLELSNVKDMDELLNSLDTLENEYGRNVQQFTYDKVMCSLEEHGMSVAGEEVLEDNSILITLNL